MKSLSTSVVATVLGTVVGSVMLCAGAAGCSSTLAQPFEANKAQPITVFRLQNYEPPAAASTAGAAGGLTAAIPPHIQQWLTAGAQMLPPGLLPPGLLPGGTPAAVATDAPRFQNFRILGSASITDKTQHDDVMNLFGKEASFDTPRQSCMFAEFGFRIGGGAVTNGTVPAGPGAPLDILVSLSCDQVAMPGYSWPYGAKNGLTNDSTKKIVAIVQKAFGG